MPHHLSCKINAKKGDNVEVEIEGKVLEISADCLPTGWQEKDQFQLFFLDKKNLRVSEKNLAKMILEEILNGK